MERSPHLFCSENEEETRIRCLIWMAVWYVIGELGSLAEHAVHMGADVPEWLPKILAVGKSAVDAAGDKIVGDEHHEEA